MPIKIKYRTKQIPWKNISAKVKRDQIILGDGSVYQEEVPNIQNSDAIQITQDEIQRLDKIPIKSTEQVVQDGSEYSAVGVKVQSIEDDRNVYR